MLFNSIDFIIFLPIVFWLYWFVVNKNLKAQNFLILVASYIFYGWWSWKFLLLIMFSTLIDYFSGIQIANAHSKNRKNLFLLLSITINLGMLMYFKYANFFIQNFIDLLAIFHIKANIHSLQLILPVGISFYTFQTMSYTIDIYRQKLSPTKDFIAFASFVSFFPQLVAGPIERATHLLPQFFKRRAFNYAIAVDGMRQILWGLFKKVVIADTCSGYVDTIFSNYLEYSSTTLLLGGVLFAFQIYGDFSGYSDIAIGTAKLFGFDLMQNFAYPYFSRNIAEFWRRWHISLSTWFRDYVYIPLGGSRVGTFKKVRNIFAIFLISGFWHGANWTYIFWGGLNAFYFLPLLFLNKNRTYLNIVAENKILPTLRDSVNILITFALTVIAWVFFRSKTIQDAFSYLVNMINLSSKNTVSIPNIVFFLLISFIFIEWLQRHHQHGLFFTKTTPFIIRWSSYFVVGFLVAFFMGKENSFIYFQF